MCKPWLETKTKTKPGRRMQDDDPIPGPARAVTAFHPDAETVALGVRQPWIELILRGVKTIEVRSQDTRIRGTIYLYASKNSRISPLPSMPRKSTA
jgi:hypothetical protein